MIRTHGNFKLEARHMEAPNLGVSMTVPDETLSVKELLDRFMRGQRIPDNLFREGVFDDSADHDSYDVEKLKSMDFAEQDEVVARLKLDAAAAEKLLADDQKRRKVISQNEKKRQRDLSALVSNKKKKRKGAAGPARDQGAKRPSKGADEGSE